jgi:hypothetical protein
LNVDSAFCVCNLAGVWERPLHQGSVS